MLEGIAAGQAAECKMPRITRLREGCEKPGTPRRSAGLFRQVPAAGSNGAHSLSLRTTIALRDIELDPLTLFKGAVAIRLDS